MIIAFSGCSGSGKTTLIRKSLKHSVLKNKKLSVKKEDSFLFLKAAKLLLGKKHVSQYVEDKKVRKSTNNYYAFFYSLFIYIEFLIEYIFYQKIFKNKIIIRDRYVVDYLVTIRKNLELDSKFINFLYINFPKPTLSFFVDANEKDIIRRNKNYKSEGWTSSPQKFLKGVVDEYKKLTKKGYIYVAGLSQSVFYIRLALKLNKVKTISFSGVDGTGKTTLVKNFSDLLEKMNIKTKVVHFYHDNVIFKFLKKVKIIKPPVLDDNYYKKTRENTKKVKKKGKNFIWALAHFTDSYIQYLVSLLFRGNRILLLDRYLYDYLVSFKYLNISGSSIFGNLISSPDIGVVVSISPKVAEKRKPENTIDFFEFCDKKYKHLAKKYNLLLLDANGKNEKDLTESLVKKIYE
ncbi:hypothetical protein ISR94_01130 [Candidatus Microgenomates bacterium]|nr:hypothetical protein [Candidatus Microgenomates bacterium]